MTQEAAALLGSVRGRSCAAWAATRSRGSTDGWTSGCRRYSGLFVEEEGIWSSSRGLRETLERRGSFSSRYTDRHSHYWHTPTAGGKVHMAAPTQFGRAMANLGIELIPSYSPAARGRSERWFGTVHGRLRLELRLESITDMAMANRYLAESFWPRMTARRGRGGGGGSAFGPPGEVGLDGSCASSRSARRTVPSRKAAEWCTQPTLEVPRS